MGMNRRRLLAGGAAAAASAPLVSARAQDVHEWKMVTTWPKDVPGLGTGANQLARYITGMTGGKVRVTVYGANELVPALESFDAVSSGTAEIGHGAAYYWKGKTEAAQYFASVPFGMTANELNAWIYYGGGQQLWDEIYAGFNLKPFLAGNTGVQMGGWFNRKIDSVEDFKGLVMRMPGLGAEVIQAVGATPKALPGGEIFPSLQSGAIDATEWVGPYNDLAFGFHKIAKYYYYPGWHEPGTGLEAFINLAAYNALPSDLKLAVAAAAQAANNDMYAEFNARNSTALDTLVNEHGVTVLHFPDGLLRTLKQVSDEVVGAVAARSAVNARVDKSFRDFLGAAGSWTRLSDYTYVAARG